MDRGKTKSTGEDPNDMKRANKVGNNRDVSSYRGIKIPGLEKIYPNPRKDSERSSINPNNFQRRHNRIIGRDTANNSFCYALSPFRAPIYIAETSTPRTFKDPYPERIKYVRRFPPQEEKSRIKKRLASNKVPPVSTGKRPSSPMP